MPKKPISSYKLASLPESHRLDIQRREAKQQATLRRGTSLKSKRLVKGQKVKRVTTKGWRFDREHLLNKGKPLKLLGVRGRRLAPEDKAAREEIKGLPCVCGCSLPVQWAHLQRRNILSTRHDPKYSIPACDYLHDWLDQDRGTSVRPQLFDLATELGRRLEHADVSPYLVGNAYYTWLYEKRRII